MSLLNSSGQEWETTCTKKIYHNNFKRYPPFHNKQKRWCFTRGIVYALLSNIILWNNNSKNLKLSEACVSTKKRVIIYLKIKECNVDNSFEIDCGPQNDTFLIGEADGQQTNYQICLKHLHWHMILFDH